MAKLEYIKDLIEGLKVIVNSNSGGFLYHCKTSKRWFVLSNNNSLDGSEPNNWPEIRLKYGMAYSYWIGDDSDVGLTFDVETNGSMSDDWLPEDKTSSFKPKKGDILHIMSEADILRLNGVKCLSGSGEYFGHHYKVHRIDSQSEGIMILCGEVIDQSGKIAQPSWLLHTKDFYEFHKITPPKTEYIATSIVTSSKGVDPCKFPIGKVVRILTSDSLCNTFGRSELILGGDYARGRDASIVSVSHYDAMTGCYILSVNVIMEDGTIHKNFLLAEKDTYEYNRMTPPVKGITLSGIGIGFPTDSQPSYMTAGAIKWGTYSPHMVDLSGSMKSCTLTGLSLTDIDQSSEKPRHLEGSYSRLRPTAEYEVEGDAVYRNKKLDAMILLNL